MPTKKADWRARDNIQWIERYCIDDGSPVCLTAVEKQQICEFYATLADPPVSGRLSAFLVLVQLCGLEARRGKALTATIDVWSLWRAASSQLQQVLRRDGERITCPELGTSYATAA
jgi:hypothetical protein